MAAGFSWYEDNGPSGLRSTTTGRTGCFWKSADTATDTDYITFPIQAGNNSFSKYQYVTFSPTYNSIANCILTHTSGTLTNMTLKCLITSAYTQPSASALAGGVDITAVGATTGAILFSTAGPTGGTTSTLTNSANGTTQYIVTQLQTTASAASGDIGSVVLTLSYDET
jgi:hypothetical protein